MRNDKKGPHRSKKEMESPHTTARRARTRLQTVPPLTGRPRSYQRLPIKFTSADNGPSGPVHCDQLRKTLACKKKLANGNTGKSGRMCDPIPYNILEIMQKQHDALQDAAANDDKPFTQHHPASTGQQQISFSSRLSVGFAVPLDAMIHPNILQHVLTMSSSALLRYSSSSSNISKSAMLYRTKPQKR